MPRSPHLHITGGDARVEAVVLLLHGGAPDSFAPVRVLDSGFLRMIPFGRSVFRVGQGRIAVASLRYAVRGWNGVRDSPLLDARWAMRRIVDRFGQLPLGLVGHSMGGRVALRITGDIGVHSVAALAPWLPPGEPLPAMDGKRVFLAHGTADRTTDPGETFDLAGKLAAQGIDVELVKVPGGRHTMLFPAKPWHDMVAEFMVRSLLSPDADGPGAHP